MKCAICGKQVTGFERVTLTEDINVHLTCFYEDIPDPSAMTDIDKQEAKEERQKLINEKAERIIKENK